MWEEKEEKLGTSDRQLIWEIEKKIWVSWGRHIMKAASSFTAQNVDETASSPSPRPAHPWIWKSEGKLPACEWTLGDITMHSDLYSCMSITTHVEMDVHPCWSWRKWVWSWSRPIGHRNHQSRSRGKCPWHLEDVAWLWMMIEHWVSHFWCGFECNLQVNARGHFHVDSGVPQMNRMTKCPSARGRVINWKLLNCGIQYKVKSTRFKRACKTKRYRFSKSNSPSFPKLAATRDARSCPRSDYYSLADQSLAVEQRVGTSFSSTLLSSSITLKMSAQMSNASLSARSLEIDGSDVKDNVIVSCKFQSWCWSTEKPNLLAQHLQAFFSLQTSSIIMHLKDKDRFKPRLSWMSRVKETSIFFFGNWPMMWRVILSLIWMIMKLNQVRDANARGISPSKKRWRETISKRYAFCRHIWWELASSWFLSMFQKRSKEFSTDRKAWVKIQRHAIRSCCWQNWQGLRHPFWTTVTCLNLGRVMIDGSKSWGSYDLDHGEQFSDRVMPAMQNPVRWITFRASEHQCSICRQHLGTGHQTHLPHDAAKPCGTSFLFVSTLLRHLFMHFRQHADGTGHSKSLHPSLWIVEVMIPTILHVSRTIIISSLIRLLNCFSWFSSHQVIHFYDWISASLNCLGIELVLCYSLVRNLIRSINTHERVKHILPCYSTRDKHIRTHESEYMKHIRQRGLMQETAL